MIFARLLIMTRYMELAAIEAALPKRTVVRLDENEWEELLRDPQFQKVHDGKDYTILNDVVVKRTPTKAVTEPQQQSTVPPSSYRSIEDDMDAETRRALDAIAGSSHSL